jgi:SAM-dependent methyltransferase
MNATTAPSDAEIKTRHRTMWASGDYPSMVETFLLPLGPRLVEAAGVRAGLRVLDVAAGTGNASIPAARTGAAATASDLTPELLEAGRRHAEADGIELDWVTADAENLPFEDASFDIVMSSIGAMFAPRHQAVADELVRVCRPGGTIALLSWTPEGMLGHLSRRWARSRRRRRPARSRHRCGAVRSICVGCSGAASAGTRSSATRSRSRPSNGRETTASTSRPATARPSPRAPTPSATGALPEFDAVLDAFCDEWNLGTPERARFEKEYLLAVGTRAED